MADIRYWLSEHVTFKPDPPGVELVQLPVDMLEQVVDRNYAVGDCDCVATLGASALLALGIECSFRVVGFSRRGGFSHVYVVCPMLPGSLDLDTTRPAQLPDGMIAVRHKTEDVRELARCTDRKTWG